MIELDYALSPSWNRGTGSVARDTAEEMALRYSFFLGDVIFLVDEMDLSARWGWVPILDFALCIDAIVDSLDQQDAHAEVFEFTESNSTIVFRRDGDSMEIDASYAPGAACVPYEDLRVAVRGFVVQVVHDVARDHPELLNNPFFAGVLRALSSKE